MKFILAVMFITGLSLEAANAADGCGVGCHGTVYGVYCLIIDPPSASIAATPRS